MSDWDVGDYMNELDAELELWMLLQPGEQNRIIRLETQRERNDYMAREVQRQRKQEDEWSETGTPRRSDVEDYGDHQALHMPKWMELWPEPPPKSIP